MVLVHLRKSVELFEGDIKVDTVVAVVVVVVVVVAVVVLSPCWRVNGVWS